MIATSTEPRVCSVCHQVIAPSESFLLRRRSGGNVAIHKHLCFPPPALTQAQPLPVFDRAA